MKVSKTATARFSDVVKACGEPEPFALWTDPARDKEFMAAVRQFRVMTIPQPGPHGGADFGIIGFVRENKATYLIFPKSLTSYKDKKIVGIKYDQIAIPEPLGSVVRPVPAARRAAKSIQPAASRSSGSGLGIKSSEKAKAPPPASTQVPSRRERFEVKIRFTAVTQRVEALEAASAKEAARLVLAREIVPDFSKATIKRKILRTRRL